MDHLKSCSFRFCHREDDVWDEFLKVNGSFSDCWVVVGGQENAGKEKSRCKDLEVWKNLETVRSSVC